MSYFDTVGAAIIEPLKFLAYEFTGAIPNIFYTAVVILFGYLLGWLLGNAVSHALHKMKFDEKFKQLHVFKPLEKIKISKVIGWITKWYTFVVFAAAGANYINLYPITDIAMKFSEWFPMLLIALAIALFGAIIAEYVHKLIAHVSIKESKVLANIAKYVILSIFIIMALDQVIDISVLEKSMLMIVGGFSIGIAIAVGIAFGLALKDEAASWVEQVKKK